MKSLSQARSMSQRQRQQRSIDSGFLDLLGDNKADFDKPMTLDDVAGTLAEIAYEFTVRARANLETANRISSGALADSMVISEVQLLGKTYQVEISLAFYYDFVNQGVKGWQNEKGGNSPYQFKSHGPSKNMVAAIRKWVIKEGLKGKGLENRRRVGLRDRKRYSIRDTSNAAAFGIAAGIKKKGLRPTYFWTRTVKEMDKIVRERLEAALVIDITNALTGK